jgi:hypothetical protein
MSRRPALSKGPLFGVDLKGKSFAIMSIDIHELNGQVIARPSCCAGACVSLRRMLGHNGRGLYVYRKTSHARPSP